VERIKREYGVECDVGEPRVNYRESVTRKAQFDFQHKKQSGGQGQVGGWVGGWVFLLVGGLLFGWVMSHM